MLVKNLYVREGRHEKRGAWTTENAPTNPGQFYLYRHEDGDFLVYGGDFIPGTFGSGWSAGGYRNAAGTWGGSNAPGIGDAVTAFGNLYAVNPDISGGSGINQVSVFDGTDFTYLYDGSDNLLDMTAATIESAIRRLFFGAPVINYTNYNTGLDYNTSWTFVNGSYDNGTEVWTTTAAAATITSLEMDFSAFSWQEANFNVMIPIQPYSATQEVPLTITVFDSVTSVVLGRLQIIVPTREQVRDVYWELLSFSMQDSTSGKIKIKYEVGTDSTAAPAAITVKLPQSYYEPGVGWNSYVAPVLTWGTFVHNPPGVEESTDDWIIWTETDNPREIRATNFMKVKDAPGPITLLRASRGRLYAFKEDSITIYTLTDIADAPLMKEGTLHGFGVIGPRAHTRFNDTHFFSNGKDVWSWDGNSEPVSIIPAGMREYLFAQTTMAEEIVVEVDYDMKELYLVLQENKYHVLNLETGAWSEHDVIGTTGTEVPVLDFIYAKAKGDTKRRMWAIVRDVTDNSKILRLNATASVRDSVAGVSQSIDAEYWFHVIESPGPRQILTLELLTIDHEITGSQTNSTLEVAISHDGGSTFTTLNTYRISPVANGDTIPIEIPFITSGKKMILRIKHTGDGTADVFNMSGATLMGQIKGPSLATSTPTVLS
jgi:hypothetical protein